jgi:hypothetical protein
VELTGGCQCGAVRYQVTGEPAHTALCHCTDCRKSAGAPVVHWACFPAEGFALLQGELREYRSSEHAIWMFCPACGTGVAYRNERVLPGMIDVQGGTLDEPERLPPQIQIQTAERLPWMASAHDLPAFERYPSAP